MYIVIKQKRKTFLNIYKKHWGPPKVEIVLCNTLITRGIGVTPYFYICYNFFLETVT